MPSSKCCLKFWNKFSIKRKKINGCHGILEKNFISDLERYIFFPLIMWQYCEHRICLLTTSVSFLSNGENRAWCRLLSMSNLFAALFSNVIGHLHPDSDTSHMSPGQRDHETQVTSLRHTVNWQKERNRNPANEEEIQRRKQKQQRGLRITCCGKSSDVGS